MFDHYERSNDLFSEGRHPLEYISPSELVRGIVVMVLLPLIVVTVTIFGLIYVVSRTILAPLNSLIDIYANWGNLYHLRSKKALQYQLLNLAVLGIGGFLFCTKVFNPFNHLGT